MRPQSMQCGLGRQCGRSCSMFSSCPGVADKRGRDALAVERLKRAGVFRRLDRLISRHRCGRPLEPRIDQQCVERLKSFQALQPTDLLEDLARSWKRSDVELGFKRCTPLLIVLDR